MNFRRIAARPVILGVVLGHSFQTRPVIAQASPADIAAVYAAYNKAKGDMKMDMRPRTCIFLILSAIALILLSSCSCG